MTVKLQRGFTLIELMMVLAVIGILATVAVPLYQDQQIRSRIVEGMNLTEDAKVSVVSGSGSAAELAAAVTTWNAQANTQGARSKYVTSVRIAATGEITVTFNATAIGPIGTANTIVLTPYVQTGGGMPAQLGTALQNGQTGSIDWGCASASNTVSGGPTRNMPALVPGTLATRYAPTDCR